MSVIKYPNVNNQVPLRQWSSKVPLCQWSSTHMSMIKVPLCLWSSTPMSMIKYPYVNDKSTPMSMINFPYVNEQVPLCQCFFEFISWTLPPAKLLETGFCIRHDLKIAGVDRLYDLSSSLYTYMYCAMIIVQWLLIFTRHLIFYNPTNHVCISYNGVWIFFFSTKWFMWYIKK